MAMQDDTTAAAPYDALVFLQGRYEALWLVSGDYLGHDNPALALLQGLNDDFERLLDAWPDSQLAPQAEGVANG